MRLLALVFGVTVHAASTVLAAFMTGLALGSAFAGRLADRVRRPLVAFADCRSPRRGRRACHPLRRSPASRRCTCACTARSATCRSSSALVRLLLSFAVLMVPTTLMGATLPLVVKSALARGTILGRQVSLLYACNTAGAIVGALVAGIWMVPQLGISWAFRIGAVINLARRRRRAAARASDGRSRSRRDPRPAAADHGAGRRSRAGDPRSPRVRRLVLLTFAVSGFVSFALEIIWFRMLVLLFRPTTYAFTVMLATVLAGIAIGSWLSTPFTSRRRSTRSRLLAVLELLIALAAVASMAFIGQAGAVYAWAGAALRRRPLAYFGPMAVTSIVAIFPPALLMGMAFPIGIAIWASDVDERRAASASASSMRSTSPARSRLAARPASSCCRRSAAASASSRRRRCRWSPACCC